MTTIHKAIAGGEGFDFVLSDETPDRMGDIMSAKGWILTNFKNNPIALWDHGKDPEIGRKPIGRWKNLRITNGKLLGTLDPARGVSTRLDELIKLIELGFLPAVSVGFNPLEGEPIDPKRPFAGTRYLKQELLETSSVAVGANPTALQVAKSLNISDETMTLAFGEHAEVRRRDMTTAGEHADTKTAIGASPSGRPSLPKVKTMTTLSQRIEALQNDITSKRDKLTELEAADIYDVDAVRELNAQIESSEEELGLRKASEAKLGISAAREVGAINGPVATGGVGAPNVARRPLGYPQKQINGFDLLVRAVSARGIAHWGPGEKSLERVLDERYPGHEATAIITKADQTIGTTTVSGWASELVQQTWADFLDALRGVSIYPLVRDRGQKYSFDGNGTVNFPSLTAGGAGGGFFAEGTPIRVGRITTASASMTARSLGVIVPFSRKLAMQSTPSIEQIVRQAILGDTSAILDGLMFDAVAGDTARPAGLLNGVAAVASGFGGGDYQSVIEDFKNVLAPFISANAADNITVIMNSGSGLNLALMQPPLGNPDWFGAIRGRVTLLESTHATANRLIAFRNSDLATALGDAPQFDVSEQATVHMEDTTPLEIVSASPTVADPVRSFWQTATTGVRMILDTSWKMRRSGVIAWVDGTTW